MERFVVEFAFRAALIAGAAALVLRVLRLRAAAAQHAVWTGVLVVMLVLPIWISWGPKAALPVLPARGAPSVLRTAAPMKSIPSQRLRTRPSRLLSGSSASGLGLECDLDWRLPARRLRSAVTPHNWNRPREPVDQRLVRSSGYSRSVPAEGDSAGVLEAVAAGATGCRLNP